MRPVRLTTNGISTSAVCPIDQYLNPTSIALGLLITGAATCTVEYTYDDVFSPTFVAASATWFPHPTLTAKSANADGNFAFPPKGVRLNQTAGAGSAVLVVNQAGAVS
jgi:hypothetical protein